MQIRELELSNFPGLLQRQTTSGIAHYLVPEKNSNILIPSPGVGIIFSVENISPHLSVFRGESVDAGIRFQEPLGPNAIRQIYVPPGKSYLLSTEHRLKISGVAVILNLDEGLFDPIRSPSQAIQITSEAQLELKNKMYRTSGMTNIFFKTSLEPNDWIAAAIKGNDVVLRFGELRMLVHKNCMYLTPALKNLVTVSIGASSPYEFSVAYFQRKYINPAYVSPEASLWALPNEAVI